MVYSDIENQRLTTNFSNLENESLENSYYILTCFNKTIYIARGWINLLLFLCILGFFIELVYIFIKVNNS
jgi:hypothetical protein